MRILGLPIAGNVHITANPYSYSPAIMAEQSADRLPFLNLIQRSAERNHIFIQASTKRDDGGDDEDEDADFPA